MEYIFLLICKLFFKICLCAENIYTNLHLRICDMCRNVKVAFAEICTVQKFAFAEKCALQICAFCAQTVFAHLQICTFTHLHICTFVEFAFSHLQKVANT